jgi:uncharacterized membrane protein YdfJ with MMPL/SSD domain
MMIGMQITFSSMKSPEYKYNQKISKYLRDYKNSSKDVENLRIKDEINYFERSGLTTENNHEADDLKISRKLIDETEQIGSKVIADLERQKDSMRGASGNVEETQQSTMQARDILQLMLKRADQRAISFIVLITFFFISICLLVYYGIIRKGM